mmetsp:Transcript_43728/g.101124  ORF Transcript_43728/g.101124 Transcript_43728/m.101124 type:complete len:84 (+) Transcript_43728:165-416(+)
MNTEAPTTHRVKQRQCETPAPRFVARTVVSTTLTGWVDVEDITLLSLSVDDIAEEQGGAEVVKEVVENGFATKGAFSLCGTWP